MPINYSLGSQMSAGSRRGNSRNSGVPKLLYGRVVDVITDAFHPEYDTYGKSLGLYGVFYSEVTTGTSEGEDSPLKFAYCANASIRRLPLKNEFVKIEGRPDAEGRDGDAATSRLFWTEIHSIWNHPHHNAYPDTLQVGEGTADLGDDFKEQEKINPLQLFPGDFTLESRYGSSLRLGGGKGEGNDISSDDNNGMPYTILRNGQHDESKDGDETILEDINKDKSSIYLTSNHKIELEQARDKHDALEEEPEKAEVFEGAQIMINSDRLFFNSREESIYFSSNKDFTVTAEQVGIDGDKYVALDATKVYLGKLALQKEKEPVLLGETSVKWLTSLMNLLDVLINTMQSAPPAPPAYCGAVNASAKAVYPNINTLKNQLKLLKSKKVFTE